MHASAPIAAADPHHGDEWTAVSKDTELSLSGTEQILKAVASKMGLGKYLPEALEKNNS